MTLCHLSQLSGVPELLGPESPACVALRVVCGANTGEGRGTAYLTPLFCLPVTSRCLTQEAKVMKDVCTRTEALVRSNLPVLASLTEHKQRTRKHYKILVVANTEVRKHLRRELFNNKKRTKQRHSLIILTSSGFKLAGNFAELYLQKASDDAELKDKAYLVIALSL